MKGASQMLDIEVWFYTEKSREVMYEWYSYANRPLHRRIHHVCADLRGLVIDK